LRWETQKTKITLNPLPKAMGTSNARPSTPGCVHYPCKGRPRILKAGKERKRPTYRKIKKTPIYQETKEEPEYKKIKEGTVYKKIKQELMDRTIRKKLVYSKIGENHKVKETRTSPNQGRNNNNEKQTERMLKPGELTRNNNGGKQMPNRTNTKTSTKGMNI